MVVGLQQLRAASKRLTDGVGESNAVGFEAYPINVHRAWEVTRDLSTFLGFQTAGFLPESDTPATPVVIFGFDGRYSLRLVDALEGSGFRVVVVGSEADFDALRRSDSQDGERQEAASAAPASAGGLLLFADYNESVVSGYVGDY